MKYDNNPSKVNKIISWNVNKRKRNNTNKMERFKGKLLIHLLYPTSLVVQAYVKFVCTCTTSRWTWPRITPYYINQFKITCYAFLSVRPSECSCVNILLKFVTHTCFGPNTNAIESDSGWVTVSTIIRLWNDYMNNCTKRNSGSWSTIMFLPL